MRKIVVQMMPSLDGYFEGPDHDLSWHLVDEELHAHFNEQLAQTFSPTALPADDVILWRSAAGSVSGSCWPAGRRSLIGCRRRRSCLATS